MVSFLRPEGSQYRMFRNSVPNYAFYIQLRHDWRFQRGMHYWSTSQTSHIDWRSGSRTTPPHTHPPPNPIKDGIENQGVICDLWVFFEIISLKAFWWGLDKGCTSCVALCYRLQSSVMDHWALCGSGAHIVHSCQIARTHHFVNFVILCLQQGWEKIRRGQGSRRKIYYDKSYSAPSFWNNNSPISVAACAACSSQIAYLFCLSECNSTVFSLLYTISPISGCCTESNLLLQTYIFSVILKHRCNLSLKRLL